MLLKASTSSLHPPTLYISFHSLGLTINGMLCVAERKKRCMVPLKVGVRRMGTAVEHVGTRIGKPGFGNLGFGNLGVGNVESEMLGSVGTVRRRMTRAPSTLWRKVK